MASYKLRFYYDSSFLSDDTQTFVRDFSIDITGICDVLDRDEFSCIRANKKIILNSTLYDITDIIVEMDDGGVKYFAIHCKNPKDIGKLPF